MTGTDLQAQIATAKAAKIAKLRAMIEVVDRGGSARAFTAAGGIVSLKPHTNRASYGGASGTCTWSTDGALIDAWRAAAIRLIRKLEDAQN